MVKLLNRTLLIINLLLFFVTWIYFGAYDLIRRNKQVDSFSEIYSKIYKDHKLNSPTCVKIELYNKKCLEKQDETIKIF